MTDLELLAWCEREPKAADTLIAAFKHTIDFQNGRGKLLRSLNAKPEPQKTAKPKLHLVK